MARKEESVNKSKKKQKKKIFVLDTSVLLFDNNSITSFQEHDVAIPITVLEELDKFKVGNETKNFEAREVIRFIDKISADENLNDWIKFPGVKKGKFKILLHEYQETDTAEAMLGKGKNDHKILNAAITLQKFNPKKRIVLVTKDINLRVKAKALNVYAENYETGNVKAKVNAEKQLQIIDEVDEELLKEINQERRTNKLEALGKNIENNSFYILKNGKSSVMTFYNANSEELEQVLKLTAMDVTPRNAEQAFALHAVLKPEIKLVTLQGVAGTGKTLLALAGALEQHYMYHQIILARPIVPLSNRDIGFLPGDAQDKISPYMQPLFDNLKFIKGKLKAGDPRYKMLTEMEMDGKLIITPLAFIRGRSLSNVVFIVDEAQNLTPHEVKTIITRAGEGTKIIFTGDVKQIDTPYLDEYSNGLAYLIDRLKGNKLFANIVLEKGERSNLANLANELL